MTKPSVAFAICAVAAALGPILLAPVRAQTPTTAPAETRPDNIGHRRHLHAHNPPLPRSREAARFTTSREAPAHPLPAEDNAFTFVVFGDRTTGPANGLAVLADAVRDTNLLEPDFVMTVGDLVQGYNTEPDWLAQMREYKEVMDRLVCPWFPVAGNHDVYWRGPAGVEAPRGGNQVLFERHFGPLWYAFRHKNCWFIALYGDEGHPETGEQAFNKPDCQKMSPAQFDWLRETLHQARDADHVFVFLHHPRWLKGGYGDDWDRVHELLRSAGNVTAVFAGHIHYMRSDGPRDGIEYVTLATTGGTQEGIVPAAGYRHHFHVVTVRNGRVALACVPVGTLMDVREITGALSEDCTRLARLSPRLSEPLDVLENGAVDGTLVVSVANPARRAVEVALSARSDESRWAFTIAPRSRTLEPGQTQEFQITVRRQAGALDDTWRDAQLLLDMTYLGAGARYPIPTRTFDVPLSFARVRPPPPAREHALNLSGQDQCLQVRSDRLPVPNGPLTVECWFNARAYGERVGLVTKTESSDYGLFVSNAAPSFFIHVGGKYLSVGGERGSLQTGVWHHIAGVYDGQEARLYLDGKLVGSEQRRGNRKTNTLPLTIGADVTRTGGAMSYFDGQIDAVRVSTRARYEGRSFQPERRPAADEATVLLLNMDGAFGPWVLDESPRGANARLVGAPRIQPAE